MAKTVQVKMTKEMKRRLLAFYVKGMNLSQKIDMMILWYLSDGEAEGQPRLDDRIHYSPGDKASAILYRIDNKSEFIRKVLDRYLPE